MSVRQDEPMFMRYIPLEMANHYRQTDDFDTPRWVRTSVENIRIDVLALLAHRLEQLARAMKVEGATAD